MLCHLVIEFERSEKAHQAGINNLLKRRTARSDPATTQVIDLLENAVRVGDQVEARRKLEIGHLPLSPGQNLPKGGQFIRAEPCDKVL
jgi:hypothetical protein